MAQENFFNVNIDIRQVVFQMSTHVNNRQVGGKKGKIWLTYFLDDPYSSLDLVQESSNSPSNKHDFVRKAQVFSLGRTLTRKYVYLCFEMTTQLLEPLELLMDETPKCDTPKHTRTSRLKVCNSDLDFTLQRLDKATNLGGLLSLNE